MSGFSFAVSEVVQTDPDRYTFTLRLYCPPDGQAITLRDCRLLVYGRGKAHIASPLTWSGEERVRVFTLPKRLRQAIIDAALAMVEEPVR